MLISSSESSILKKTYQDFFFLIIIFKVLFESIKETRNERFLNCIYLFLKGFSLII